jgi:hypothetical protein
VADTAAGAGKDINAEQPATSCSNNNSVAADPVDASDATRTDTSLHNQQHNPAAAAGISKCTAADALQQQQQQQQSAGPKQRHFAPQTRLQQGVLRTNCIDCLDRTNVAQFAYGLAAFGRQLAALGVLGDEEGGVDSDSSIAFQLMEMYEGMGHTIALQVRCSKAWDTPSRCR